MRFVQNCVRCGLISMGVAFLLLFFLSAVVFGQGALLPALPPAFTNASGVAASSAKLCAFAAGTTTPLTLYSDSALTTTAPNPNTLNSIGQPTSNGSTRISLYVQPRNYKIILYAAGATGASCPLTGTAIFTQDNVFDAGLMPSFDNVQLCSRHQGANSAAQIVNAIAALPSTGGRVQCDYTANQTWPSDPFSGVTKPVDIEISGATITQSVDVSIPANVNVKLSQGAIISVASSQTLTILSGLDAPAAQIFAGTGTKSFIGNQKVEQLHARWWGAVGDDSTANATALQAWANAAEDSGITAWLDAGVYLTASQILVTLPASKQFIMKGPGEDLAQIKLSGTLGAAATPMFFIDGASSPTESLVEIEGISFLGNSNVGTGLEIEEIGLKTVLRNITVNGFTGYCIVLDRSTFGIAFEQVRASGCGIWGLDATPVPGSQGVGEGTIKSSKFEANGTNDCVTGGQINFGEDATFITITGTVFYGGVGCYRGIHMDDDVSRIGLYQNSFEGISGPAIWSDAGEDVFAITIVNNGFECVAASGTVQCLDFESSLEGSTITGNTFSLTSVGGSTIQGISVTGTANQNMIGNNVFLSMTGAGTETEYVPADIQKVWLSWSPAGAARASFNAMENRTWATGTATGYGIINSPLSENVADGAIVITDLDTNTVGYLKVSAFGVGLALFAIQQGGTITVVHAAPAGDFSAASTAGDISVYYDAGVVKVINRTGATRPIGLIFDGIP